MIAALYLQQPARPSDLSGPFPVGEKLFAGNKYLLYFHVVLILLNFPVKPYRKR